MHYTDSGKMEMNRAAVELKFFVVDPFPSPRTDFDAHRSPLKAAEARFGADRRGGCHRGPRWAPVERLLRRDALSLLSAFDEGALLFTRVLR